MFDDDTDVFEEQAERILRDLDLDDVMDMNNLTDVDVLALLIREGLIEYPEFYNA